MLASLFDRIIRKQETIAVTGLGYVGMPIGIEFAKTVNVIGFDSNRLKIGLYLEGHDPTSEVGDDAIQETTMVFTSDADQLRRARFHIVAVPTPINQDKTPDLRPVESAARTIGENLAPGSIVVFESTVYPGVTEDICVPILEEASGLTLNEGFYVGYSPERINPGDRVHTLRTIKKIVSASSAEALDVISRVYELVVKAGVYPVSNIRTAEAVKVAENSQRDINIAFVNELAMAFDRMGIDTNEVVDGMNTKWNALGFRPGLVGGHCIGVDPYYFTYEAERLGYHSQIVLAGRKVNDGMGAYVADAAIKQMVRIGLAPARANVAILGLTFKENCPDCRNSKVGDIISRLREYGIEPQVVDPFADEADAIQNFGVKLTSTVKSIDCLIVAVAHRQFRELGFAELERFFSSESRVLIDVKGIFNASEAADHGFSYWRL